jgi:hypothetical protein
MTPVGDDRTVWNNATSYAVRSCHGVTGAAACHGVIGATVVVKLDELIIRAIWTTDAKLRDD